MSLGNGQVRFITGNSWKRRRAAGGDDRQCKSIQHRGIHGRVSGRCQLRFGCSSEALVEMQRHAPMTAAREQRVRKLALLILLQQRGGQPGGAVTVQKVTHLAAVSDPEHVALRSTGAVVGDNELGIILLYVCGFPKMAGRDIYNEQRHLDREILRRLRHPVHEWPPNTVRLRPVQSLEHHRNLDSIGGLKGNLLAPMPVK